MKGLAFKLLIVLIIAAVVLYPSTVSLFTAADKAVESNVVLNAKHVAEIAGMLWAAPVGTSYGFEFSSRFRKMKECTLETKGNFVRFSIKESENKEPMESFQPLLGRIEEKQVSCNELGVMTLVRCRDIIRIGEC